MCDETLSPNSIIVRSVFRINMPRELDIKHEVHDTQTAFVTNGPKTKYVLLTIITQMKFRCRTMCFQTLSNVRPFVAIEIGLVRIILTFRFAPLYTRSKLHCPRHNDRNGSTADSARVHFIFRNSFRLIKPAHVFISFNFISNNLPFSGTAAK